MWKGHHITVFLHNSNRRSSHLLLIRQIQRIHILPCKHDSCSSILEEGGEGYGKWGVGLARYVVRDWGKYWCHSRPFIFTFEGVALYHWLLPYKLPINYFCKNSIGECCVPLFVDRTVHTSWSLVCWKWGISNLTQIFVAWLGSNYSSRNIGECCRPLDGRHL